MSATSVRAVESGWTSTKRDGVLLIDNEHGGTGQANCTLRVDLGQVEPKCALGLKNVVGLIERDAGHGGYPIANLQGQIRRPWVPQAPLLPSRRDDLAQLSIPSTWTLAVGRSPIYPCCSTALMGAPVVWLYG